MPLDLSSNNGLERMENLHGAVSNIANGSGEESQNASIRDKMQGNFREMNAAERLMAGSAKLGRDVAQSSGFGKYVQDQGGLLPAMSTAEGWGRFLMNLPTGMASAIPSGVANVFAGLTGSNVTYGADTESGMITNEELNAGQKAASLVTGGIDTLGLLLGGSGSLLHETNNVLRAGRGLAPAKGMFWNGATLFDSAGKQLAFDAVEEGAEEIAQSISEDVIQNQLDGGSFQRALEGGVMGAIGGGIMSGGALGLRYATGNGSKAETTTTAPQKTVYGKYDALRDSFKTGANLPAEYREAALKEGMRKSLNPVDGSISSRLVPIDRAYGPNQMGLGNRDLCFIFDSSENGANRVLWLLNGGRTQEEATQSAAHPLTMEDAYELLHMPDDEAAAAAINDILHDNFENNRMRRIVLKKDPGTMNGSVWVSLDLVFPGYGIQCNTATEQVLNADEDSDSLSVFISTGDFSPNAWASERILSELGPIDGSGNAEGSSRVQFKFGVLAPGSGPDRVTARKNLEAKMNIWELAGIRENDNFALQQGARKDVAEFNKVVKELADILETEPKSKQEETDRDNAIARHLDMISKMVSDFYYNYRQHDASWSEDSVKNASRLRGVRAVDEVFSSYASWKISNAVPVRAAEAKTLEQVGKLKFEEESLFEIEKTPGRTNDKGMAMKPDETGLGGTYGPELSDQVFRDAPATLYNMVKTIMVNGNDQDIRRASALAFQSQLTAGVVASGTNPDNTISDMFNAMLMNAVLYAYSIDQQANNRPQLPQILAAYARAYRDNIDEFNDALKKSNGHKEIKPLGTVERGPLDFSGLSDEDMENDDLVAERVAGDSAFVEDFMKTVSDYLYARALVPPEVVERQCGNRDASWNEFILSFATKENSELAGYSGTMKTFIRNCMIWARGENAQTDRLALNLCNELDSEQVTPINGVIAAANISAIRNLGVGLSYLVIPECAIRCGAVDIMQFGLMNTDDLGYKFAWGKAEEKLNIAIGINFMGKFSRILEFYANQDNVGKDLPDNLERELAELESLDIVHQTIAGELRTSKNGVSETLTKLCDDTISYRQKTQFINDIFGRLDPTVENGVYALSAKRPVDWSSPLIERTANQRIREGMQAASRYKKSLLDSARQEWGDYKRQFDSLFNESGKVSMTDQIMHAARRRRFVFNYDLFSVGLSEIATITAEQAEKGKAGEAVIKISNQNEFAKNGSRYGFIERLMNSPFGCDTLESFQDNAWAVCRLMSEPDFKIHLVDEYGTKTGTFTYDGFWKWVDGGEGNFKEDGEVNDVLIVKLFDKFPQLFTMLGGFTMQSSSTTGSSTYTIARAGSAIDDAWEAFASQHDEKAALRKQVEDDLMTVELELNCSAVFWQVLYATLPRSERISLITGHGANSKIVKENAKAIVRAVYASIVLDKMTCTGAAVEQTLDERISKDIADGLNASLADLVDLAKASITGRLGSYDSLIQKDVLEYALDVTLASRIKPEDLPAIKGMKQKKGKKGKKKQQPTVAAPQLPQGLTNVPINVLENTTEEIRNLIGAAVIVGTTELDERLRGAYKGAYERYATRIVEAYYPSNISEKDKNDAIRAISEQMQTHDVAQFIPSGVNDVMHYEDRENIELQYDEAAFDKWLDDVGSLVDDATLGNRRDALRTQYKNAFVAGIPDPVRMKRVITAVDGIALAYYINDIDGSVLGINPDLMTNSSELSENLSNFVTSFSGDIKPLASERLSRWISGMPSIDVSSREDAIMLERIVEAVNSGKVPGDVSMNGASAKWMIGLDSVPQNRSIESVGNLDVLDDQDFDLMNMRADLVLDVVQADPSLLASKVVLPGSTTPVKVANALSQLQGLGTQTVRWYDPTLNPHGIFSEFFFPVAGNSFAAQNFNRFSGALHRVLMESMENLVLKTRKKFNVSTVELVGSHGSKTSAGSTWDNIADNKEALANYWEFVNQASKDIFSSSLASKLGDVGFSRADVMLFVQAMTVGWKVKIDTTGNGDYTYGCIDVLKMWDSAQWADAISRMSAQGTIVEFELEVLPLKAVSARIARIVAETPPDSSSDEIAEAAFKAMTSWSSFNDDDPSLIYEPETLTYDELIGGISPRGFGRSNIISDLSHTPVQNLWLSELDKRGYAPGRNPRSKPVAVTKVSESSNEARAIETAYNSFNNDFQIEGKESYKFTMVFGGENADNVARLLPGQRGAHPSAIASIDELSKHRGEIVNGQVPNALVLDMSRFADAVMWADSASQNGQCYVTVPEAIFYDSVYGNIKKNAGVKKSVWMKDETGKMREVSCIQFAVRQSLVDIVFSQGYDTKGAVGRVNRNTDFLGTLLDEEGYYGDTDPAIHVLDGILSNISTKEKSSEFVFEFGRFEPKPEAGQTMSGKNWIYGVCSPSELEDLRQRMNVPTREKELRDQFQDSIDKLSSRRGDFGSAYSIWEKTKLFLADPSNQATTAGDVVAIGTYKNKSTGTTYYIPIIVPRTVTKMTNCAPDRKPEAGRFRVRYTTRYSLVEKPGGHTKLSLMYHEAAYKAMAVIDTLMDGNEGYTAHTAYPAAENRTHGRERQFFYNSAYHYMIREGWHMLLEPASDVGEGALRVRPEFRQFFTDHKNSWSATINGLWGLDSIWGQLLAGNDFGIFSQKQMRVIQSALNRCQKYYINPMTVFGASQWRRQKVKDGEKINNWDAVYVASDEQAVTNIDLVFSGLSGVTDIARFFNAIGGKFNLCEDPDLQGSQPITAASPKFNSIGRFLTFRDGEYKYRQVLWDQIASMGVIAEEEAAGHPARISPQQRFGQIAMHGVGNDSEFARGYSAWLINDLDSLDLVGSTNLAALDGRSGEYLNKNIIGSLLESKRRSEIAQTAREIQTYRRMIVKELGDTTAIELQYGKTNTPENRGYTAAIDNLKSAIGFLSDGPIDSNIMWILLNAYDGASKLNGELTQIPVDYLIKNINEMANDYRRYGLIVRSNPTRDKARGRYAIPQLPDTVIDYLDSHTNGQFVGSDYRQKVEENRLVAIEAVGKIKEHDKRLALKKYASAVDYLNGRDSTGYDDLWAGYDIVDIAQTDTVVADLIETLGFDIDAFTEFQELQREKMVRAADVSKRRDKVALWQSGRNLVWKEQVGLHDSYGSLDSILDHIVEFSRAMSVFNHGVFVGNIVGRISSQSIMEFALQLSAKGIGPYCGRKRFSRKAVEKITNDEGFDKGFKILRLASVTGQDVEALGQIRNPTEFKQAMARIESEMDKNLYRKGITKVFNFANGLDIGIKQQERLFLTRFLNYMEADPMLRQYLEINPETGNMFVEDEFASDPGGFFMRCFSTQGSPQFYSAAKFGLQSARTGDLAQDHWLATLLWDLGQIHPVGRFFFSTCICKFPKYAFNATDKLLKWALPMSTINYVMTAAAAKADKAIADKYGLESHDLELTQKYVNIQEAIMCDVCHLGVTATLGILLVIGEGIEPPDDPDKWSNPDEWLICGMRIGESWWMTDVFGVLLPSALAMKAVSLGKPEAAFPLLLNGSLNACYSNPLIRVSDCTNVLLDWDDGVARDYDKIREQFKDAKGGAPGFLDYVQTNSTVGFASWLTKLVTPSLIRDLYRSEQDFERSYKRVYRTTSTGKTSEKGEQGYTEMTTYSDAMMRRACLSNPFLAVIMNVTHPGVSTGYWWSQMPCTVYLDPAEVESAKTWSIEGLNQEEKNTVMELLYAYINSHTEEEMKQDGFRPNSETMSAFSSWLWDSYYEVKNGWEQALADGALDAALLGDGDEDAGWKIYHQMKASKDAVLKHLSDDIYYGKLKGTYLAQKQQQYNRYATSYRTDLNGELYATGIRRQGILPFLSGPGTTKDPEGTAGYEEDFSSISAVTGKPMGERALVPVPAEYEDWPTFESWSKNGDGKGYSGKWSVYSGTSGDSGTASSTLVSDFTEQLNEAAKKAKNNPSTTGQKYYRSGGGGGGGYTRRSSGGSSYVPGISSRNYTPNTPNAATARTSRQYDATLDYLRPGVETKGSRDANRRGDI